MTDLILLRDFQASQIEFWLPTEYTGYDVSSFGRVRSYIGIKNFGHGYERVWFDEPHILKLSVGHHGYLRAGVARNEETGQKIVKSVHRLVADAFISNPNNYPQPNHLNLIPSDNRMGNLEWCTPQENTLHAIANGRMGSVGDTNHNAKLNNAERAQIALLREAGMKGVDLARQFKVTTTRISQIWKAAVANNSLFTHLPTV